MVADTRFSGSASAARRAPRVPSSDRASYNTWPRRSTTVVDSCRRSFSSPAGSGPIRIQSAAATTTALAIADPDTSVRRVILMLDVHDGRRGASKHFRFVHLFGVRRRRAERAGRRRANDVRELVAPFREASREELNAIVVPLDVIEAAVLPPAAPVTLLFQLALVLCQGRRRCGEPRFDRLET